MKNSCLLGFDIGGTKCAAVLGTAASPPEIIGRHEFPTTETPNPEECLDRLADAGCALLNENRIPRDAVTNIGVSCGGPLDSRSGLVKSPPNLRGWNEVPVTSLLSRRYSASIRLQNDANACALAEWRWGAARGSKTCVFLTFGTGLGAGLIIDGKLHSGLDDSAGEVGHWRLAPDGPVGFGKAGSFEGFCSGAGLARSAELHALPGLDARALTDRARLGDAEARAIIQLSAEKLGHGLALVIDLLNPEVIVLGGIFARCEDLYRPAMEGVVGAEALPLPRRRCRILPAALGERVGDFAALAVALEAEWS